MKNTETTKRVSRTGSDASDRPENTSRQATPFNVIETTEERYEDMLGAVPPINFGGSYFLCGEPVSERKCRVTGGIAFTYDAFFASNNYQHYYTVNEPITGAEFKKLIARKPNEGQPKTNMKSRKEYQRDWRQAHPGYMREAARRHRLTHPSSQAARCRRNRLAHPGQHYQRVKAYFQANPEKEKAYRLVKPLDVRWLCALCHKQAHSI